MRSSHQSTRVGRSLVLAAATLVPLVAGACGSGDDDGPDDRTATMAGLVALSPVGGVAGAAVEVNQLTVTDNVGGVRMRIGETVTASDGGWEMTHGFSFNHGLFEVVSRGGSFTDLVSGETIVLDPTDELRAFAIVDLYEDRTGVLVSPISDLTAAYARYRLSARMHDNLQDAYESASALTFRHFADVPWDRIDPAPLDQPASSATPAVRASLILGAMNIMVDDIAVASGASRQEAHAFALAKAWTADLAAPPFDGNDNNDNTHGSGLQVGECAPLVGCQPNTSLACTLGECRENCDLFAGSPRSTLHGALLKLARSPLNQTGLSDTAILPIARALADATEPALFGDACRDSADRTPPSVFFEAPTPPADAFVRDTITVRVRATDDLDMNPDLVFLDGLVDTDGDPTNAVATAEIATDALPDGALTVSAQATDSTGLQATTSRSFTVDNTDPQITMSSTGFYVSGADWWTGSPTPTIGGMLTEVNLDTITVFADGVMVGTATPGAGSWTMTLPAGTIPGVTGKTIRVDAVDRAGNTASVSQRIRYDATPPVITIPDTTVRDESGDTITFDQTIDPIFGVADRSPTHAHGGAAVTLGPATACDVASARKVTKYAYLLDEQPLYASESNGAGPGGRNPLRWAMAISDDGVGVDYATVAYRIRDVATNTFPLDWTPLAGTGAYTVNLFRTASSGPSIPVLGTKEGVFEIQFRGRDRLNRDADVVTRCWNHDLLAAPLDFGFPSVTMPGGPSAPTNGPAGSGKYGLTAATFSLADTTSPYEPISMLMNAPTPGTPSGVGLMQFPVYNPTNETVYLSIDVVRPTAGVAGKRYYQNRWTFNETTVSTLCGTDPGGGPNHETPGCEPVTYPGTGTTTLSALETTSIPPSSYSIRVWEEPVGTGSYIELTQCPGCSTTSTDMNTRTRVTVMIPPRGPPVTGAPPPRKFWIVPVLVGPIGLQPGAPGPYTEFTAGGATMSGAVDETRTGCVEWTPLAPYRCLRRRTYRKFRATWRAEVTGIGDVRAFVRSSWTTSGDEIPTYVLPDTGLRVANILNWYSDEPIQPTTPTPP